MKIIINSVSAVILGLGTLSAYATPSFLTTHNTTNEESNAFVAGNLPSPYPTAANTTRQVYWNMVRLACYGHIVDGKCPAVIKMATNTSSPISLGTVSMDVQSGEITPKTLSAAGYLFRVDGPGEATITYTKDN